MPEPTATQAIEAMASRLQSLSPEVEAALLEQTGFEPYERFHVAFTFEGG